MDSGHDELIVNYEADRTDIRRGRRLGRAFANVAGPIGAVSPDGSYYTAHRRKIRAENCSCVGLAIPGLTKREIRGATENLRKPLKKEALIRALREHIPGRFEVASESRVTDGLLCNSGA